MTSNHVSTAQFYQHYDLFLNVPLKKDFISVSCRSCDFHSHFNDKINERQQDAQPYLILKHRKNDKISLEINIISIFVCSTFLCTATYGSIS